MTWSREMRSTPDVSRRLRSLFLLCIAAGAHALLFSAGAGAQEKPVPAAAAAQKTFATAREAAEALVSASESFDAPAMKAILGPDGEDLVVTGEPVKDRDAATAFAAKAREKLSVDTGPEEPQPRDPLGREPGLAAPHPDRPDEGRVALRLEGRPAGDPLPSHRRERAGRHPDLPRVRRGAARVRALKRDGSGVNQYAQRIISTPGKQDGLAWRNPDGTWEGPVGEDIARIIELGYTDKATPYHGYFFKVLKGQGPAAPMGEMDFVVKGVMIGGFALVAAPAEYLVTGVKTFIVSHDGVVYEKDLGDGTLNALKTMERFNPDKTWKRVIEE